MNDLAESSGVIQNNCCPKSVFGDSIWWRNAAVHFHIFGESLLCMPASLSLGGSSKNNILRHPNLCVTNLLGEVYPIVQIFPEFLGGSGR